MRRPDYDRRVVVTGLGVISPVGNDVQTAWGNLVHGRSGLREITKFDVSRYEAKAAGEVRDFNAADWMDPKAVRRSESAMWFGVAAAKQALQDSGFEITDENREEVGVVYGSGAGGQQLMIDAWISLHEKGPRSVPPTFIANALVDSTSGMIAIETGAIGHNVCIVSACATGTHSVAEGAEAIRRGDCVAVISGSTEAPLLETAHAGFTNMRGMGLPRAGEPLADVSRPFDKSRDGFVLGEGAGVLVLERASSAAARGRTPYAVLGGAGITSDSYDIVAPDPEGTGQRRAAKTAIERAGVALDDVVHVNAHATSTPTGDGPEAAWIAELLGEDTVVTATKSMTGHLLGAAGAIEAIATVLSVARDVVPPTINLDDPDDDVRVDVPREAREMTVSAALNDSFGFGGHNTALLFRKA